jgi:hypothetical protein
MGDLNGSNDPDLGQATGIGPYQPSWAEQFGGSIQDALEALGLSRGNAQTAGRRAQQAGYFTPAIGQLWSGNDALRAAGQGDWPSAAISAVGALPIPGARAVEAPLTEGAENVARAITAYHGSPHGFDKFDIGKVGTGEGAQAFGHGLYFADNEDVAKGYRDRLGQGTYSTDNGAAMGRGQAFNELHNAMTAGGVHPNIAHQVASNALDTIDEAGSAAAAKQGYYVPPDPRSDEAYRIAFDHAEKLGLKPNLGHMYQVGINANPEHFLDWDKPLGEQSDYIQEALGHAGETPYITDEDIAAADPATARFLQAQQTYLRNNRPLGMIADAMQREAQGRSISATNAARRDELLDMVKDPSKAPLSFAQEVLQKPYVVQQLRNAGIPGVRYFDAGSRGAGAGSHNYVVFDDKLIDVLKRYGLGGLGIAGVGGAAALSSPQPAQAGQ